MGTDAATLCTVAQVKEQLRQRRQDDDRDALMASLCVRATGSIQDHCEREFLSSGDTFTPRDYLVGTHGLVSLAPHDLREVNPTSGVVLSPDGSAIEVSSSNYRLEPVPSRDGTFLMVRIAPESLCLLTETDEKFGAPLARISGKWGMLEVPAAVNHAAIITVLTWLSRNFTDRGAGAVEEGVRADSPRPVGSLALPAAARHRLSDYKRAVL